MSLHVVFIITSYQNDELSYHNKYKLFISYLHLAVCDMYGGSLTNLLWKKKTTLLLETLVLGNFAVIM